MEPSTNTLTGEVAGSGKNEPLRIGVNVFTAAQIAKREKVSTRTVERWITKQHNALPALRVTAEQMRSMGYTGNLPSSKEFFFLVKKADLALIPSVRQYPAGTKRPNRVRKGTTTGAGASDRQE